MTTQDKPAVGPLTYVSNCVFYTRDGDPPIFSDEHGGPGLLVRLDGYVIVPRETYDELASNARLAPTAPVETLGETLHPATADLVDRFAAELKSKLAKAEAKYGYRDDWSKSDWKDELIESLAEHVQKGDPRDVAAYCAFAWHHGWSTSDAAGHLTGPFSPPSENGQSAWTDQDTEDLLSDAIGDSFDMDWSARDGAKAVLSALKREGLLVVATPSEAPAGLTPAEQKTQGARCGCRGADDMCPCQNTPDRQTIKDRSDA